jgi:TetR/AcrR family transcriptional regulator
MNEENRRQPPPTPPGGGRRAKQHRSPAPEERVRDAERSRTRLLEAALDEFAAKGYAGARVSDIAVRAGLNKQLITYYFGGKRGLYRALEDQWLANEAEVGPPDMPLDELIASHLRALLADPRHSRLLLWQGLTGSAAETSPEDDPAVADMGRRKELGELADDLDPSMVLIALMGAALAPVSIPQVVRRSTGLDPSDEKFERRYAQQLSRIVQRLAQPQRRT